MDKMYLLFLYVYHSVSCAVLSVHACIIYNSILEFQRKRQRPAETESMTRSFRQDFAELAFFVYLILLTLVSHRPLFITSCQSKAFPQTVI